MLALAALLYSVHVLPAPIGQSVVLAPGQYEATWVQQPYRRPNTVAIARDGAVAYVAGDGFSGFAHQLIIITQADGTHKSLRRPGAALLATNFAGVYVSGPHGEKSYPNAQIKDIVLADDGTPFATIGFVFAGGYEGLDESSFVWHAAGWHPAVLNRLPTAARNIRVAVAESLAKTVYIGDFLNDSPADVSRQHEQQHYHEDDVVLVDGTHKYLLGHGTATSMRGLVVVGYQVDSQQRGSAAAKPLAVAWSRGRRLPLGRGIAWGVNGRADVVGDDRRTMGEAGHPSLWHAGRVIRLSKSIGSAYAIADDGTIVGDVREGGFVFRPRDTSRAFRLLDTLLRDPGWHVRHAYGMSINGDILAIVTGRNHHSEVALLHLGR